MNTWVIQSSGPTLDRYGEGVDANGIGGGSGLGDGFNYGTGSGRGHGNGEDVGQPHGTGTGNGIWQHFQHYPLGWFGNGMGQANGNGESQPMPDQLAPISDGRELAFEIVQCLGVTEVAQESQRSGLSFTFEGVPLSIEASRVGPAGMIEATLRRGSRLQETAFGRTPEATAQVMRGILRESDAISGAE